MHTPVSATLTEGVAGKQSHFLNDVCTSLTEALSVTHCPSVTFCWLHAIFKVSQRHTWWEKCQRTCRYSGIATSDCRCKRSGRSGSEIKAPSVSACVPCSPHPQRKVLPKFFLPCWIHPAVRTRQDLVEHLTGPIESLDVRK